MKPLKIGVVIPVYNDHHNLQELLLRLFKVSDTYHYKMEILLVDDGSIPETWERIKYIKNLYSSRQIILIRLSKNQGQHIATLCGLLHSISPILLTMDADLQHQPEDIPTLVSELLKTKSQLVYGIPSEDHTNQRRLTGKLFYYLTRPIGRNVPAGSAFRCLDRQLLEQSSPHFNKDFCFLDAVFLRTSQGISSISTCHMPRHTGVSRYTFASRVSLFLKIITIHSTTAQKILVLFSLTLMTAYVTAMLYNSHYHALSIMPSLLLTAFIFIPIRIIHQNRKSQKTGFPVSEIIP